MLVTRDPFDSFSDYQRAWPPPEMSALYDPFDRFRKYPNDEKRKLSSGRFSSDAVYTSSPTMGPKPGAAKRCQEEPGGAKRSLEEPGGARSYVWPKVIHIPTTES